MTKFIELILYFNVDWCMDWIPGFERDLRARGLTPQGILTYRSQVKFFLRAFAEPSHVNSDDLRVFLEELRARNLSASTLKGYFSSISAFFDYMIYEGLIEINPVLPFRKRYLSRLKVQGETRQLISIEDMRSLVAAAPGIREKSLIMTLAKTGMRRGELLGMKVESLDLKNDIIRIPRKAKRTNCIAFLDDELKAVIQEYLSWRHKFARSDWLWITGRGGRIHRDYPNQVLAGLGSSLGLHQKDGPISLRLTPHCMRHFFTTHLFRNGMNEQYIMFLRGDSMRKESWQHYNHFDLQNVKQEYLRCVPFLN